MKKVLSAVILLLVLAVLFTACMITDSTQDSTSAPASGSSSASVSQSVSSGNDSLSSSSAQPSSGSQAPSESQSTAPSASAPPSQSAASTASTSATRPSVPIRPTSATSATASTAPTVTTAPTSATQPDSNTGNHLYTAFTSSEKALLQDAFGEVIPFAPNDEYSLDEYTYGEEWGYNFYTYGNTQAEYNSYRSAFIGYTLDGTYQDDYGDTWYSYSKNDFYVDMCYYPAGDGRYVLDVYVFILSDDGGSGGSGSGGSSGGSSSGSDIITNNGKGLPKGTGGVYDVDFTDAENVKDVTDQGYYLDGCPTKGSPGVLVIPVEFSDVTAQSKGYSISALKNAFGKNGTTDYYSVYDYYYTSSYGQLTLDITVLDSWFLPQYSSSYYQNATMEYYGQDTPIGDQMILDEALAYLEGIMDLSQFDSDNNGIIDSVVLVTTLDIGDDDFHWAYRYWNIYTDDEGYYYTYDGVSANDYLWASYRFLYEEDGSYTNTGGMNTYTFIHEFGHILGADDYYDTEGNNSPLSEADVMDSTPGDHNAFTKFNLGWITASRLVTTDTAVTLTLDTFSKTGDTILLACDWDPDLGAYQEYYILVYYRNTGLNTGAGGYFDEEGILVYHVDASLYKEVQDGEVYYDIYYNNSSSYGQGSSENNLIEYVKQSSRSYVYGVGDSLGTVYSNSGSALEYTFTVNALNGDTATITFTKK